MLLHGIALLLIASPCFAQTTGAATSNSPLDDITALTAQANQGNADAQIKLGGAHLSRRGVAQSNAEPVRLFRAAPENGNAKRRAVLGPLYAAGVARGRDDGGTTQ